MSNQIVPPGTQKLQWRFFFTDRIKIFLPIFLINLLFISSSSFGQGFSTVDFHQAQNDRNGAKTYLIDWVNGALNSTHTDYWEGIGVPQRIVMTGILPNNANSNVNKHSIRFQVLASKGSKHAYDFPISWDQAFKTAEDIGGSVNELQNLFIQQCGDAFSAIAKTTCNELTDGSNDNVTTAEFPDAIGNPGKPTIGAPNVDDNIDCFEAYKRFGEATERYGNRLIEIRGNAAISNVTVTFTGYQGSGKDYAEYLLTWESTSDKVMIRFATRLAPGNGRCGYGSGNGAGSINGAPYHVTLIRFDDVDDPSDNAPESGVSMGSQDNQIMSNAIQIPPPQCGLSNGSSGCTNTATSFTVNYISADAANATVKFYFTSNTAGAKLPNSVTAVGNCTTNTYSVVADAAGSASISITPSGSEFTQGSFRIGACVTGAGGSTTCEQPSATTIDAASVVAKVNGNVTTLASPHTINSNLSNQTAALTALGTLNGIQDNTLFSSFVWTVASQTDAPGNIAVIGDLSNVSTSTGNATFTPATQGSGYQEGLYAFKVTATSTANGCVATALVFINVSGGASCPTDITGPSPVCEQTAGLVYSSASLAAKNPFPEAGLTYTWSIVPAAAATITSSSVNVTSITVTAGTVDFVVKVTVTNQHGETFTSSNCEFPVDVVARPTVSAIYNPPGCSDQSFSVDVPNSVSGWSYTVTQPNSNPASGYNTTKAGTGGTLNFTGLALGGGFLVTVSNPNVTGSCTGSTDCAGSANSCASESITQSKIATDKVIGAIKEPIIPKSEEYEIVLESPTKVKAVPNPYTDKIRFNLVSGVSGIGTLELYNLQGQKVGVVFEGYVQAGREFSKEYVVTGERRTNLIYVFRVGDQRVSGKLINQK